MNSYVQTLLQGEIGTKMLTTPALVPKSNDPRELHLKGLGELVATEAPERMWMKTNFRQFLV